MENNPRTMPARLRESRHQTLQTIMEHQQSPPTPMMVREMIAPPDRLHQARDIVEWNEEAASKFWKQAQSIRDLCIVFLILFRDRNPLGASQSITDRMPDADLLTDLLGQLTWRRQRTLKRLILNPQVVFHDLEYQPFDEENVTYHGIEMLQGMRKYAR
jgi:hypothetical protein